MQSLSERGRSEVGRVKGLLTAFLESFNICRHYGESTESQVEN